MTDAAPSPPATQLSPAAPLPPAALAVGGLEGLRRPASLCYGEPLREGGRTLVPVARVRVGDRGGSLDATPVGVLELGPEGARFTALHERRDGVVPALAGVVAGVVAGVAAGALRRRARRSPLRRRSRR